MEAPIGLQVACHIGDNRLAGLEHSPVGQRQGGVRVGAEQVGVDALMDDLDLVPIGRRMQAVLPVRWGDALVAVFQVEQVQRVAAADARVVVHRRRKLGVEAHIRTLRVVVVLAEVDQPGVGKGIFGIERLAPAGVGDYHVGPVALALEVEQQP